MRVDKNFIMLPRTIKVKWEFVSDGLSLHLNDFEHKTILLSPSFIELCSFYFCLTLSPVLTVKSAYHIKRSFFFFLQPNSL